MSDNFPIYYLYSRHMTREEAEDALRGYFATGIVSEEEHPKVDEIRIGWPRLRKPWAVMFLAA